MHKNKLKMDKDLNGSQDALKHLEGNIGKALSELNHTSIFSCQSPKAIEMKRKLIQWYWIKLKGFCTAKETIKN